MRTARGTLQASILEGASVEPFQEAAARVQASTVKVWREIGEGLGTAFYIGEGQFVTAGHVVAGETHVLLTNAVHDYSAVARVVGWLSEEGGDLAIIAVTHVPQPRSKAHSPLAPLKLAGVLDAGQEVGVAGYPSGFNEADLRNPAAVTRGVLSRHHREGNITYVQTDAAVNPGNSGGPLFDLNGQVAGVVTWKFISSEGVGFAVAEPSLSRLLGNIRTMAAKNLSCMVSQSAVQPAGVAGIVCTVTDDAGWLVAGIAVSADIVQGDGRFADIGKVATDERGQATLAYLAPSTAGLAVIEIRAGALRAFAEVAIASNVSIVSSDAPEWVEMLSESRITVTVTDDEGVLVGGVPISIEKIEGGGLVDAPGEMTFDGRASFTFYAPNDTGKAVFLVRAGDAAKGQQIQETITVLIGDAPAPALPSRRDEPPARQTSWSEPLTPGTWNLVWNGADDAAPSDGVTAGVVAISWWNGEAWDSYFPSAGNVPGLNTLASLSKGAAYWVVVE
ncbi:MAG: serine protease [Dehalococcoidia bacterium]|nr:serine protease [Dehalococcoidia bacterium]MYA52123.1 serine protease [Dehalococcoidia bacterium]